MVRVVSLREKFIIDAHTDYRKATNMSVSEVLKFLRSPCSKVVKPRRVVNQTLKLLGTPRKKWDMGLVRISKRHISFIKRNKRLKRGRPVSCGLSRRSIMLMAYGFNSNKK